jgi:hypothetical protein
MALHEGVGVLTTQEGTLLKWREGTLRGDVRALDA